MVVCDHKSVFGNDETGAQRACFAFLLGLFVVSPVIELLEEILKRIVSASAVEFEKVFHGVAHFDHFHSVDVDHGGATFLSQIHKGRQSVRMCVYGQDEYSDKSK